MMGFCYSILPIRDPCLIWLTLAGKVQESMRNASESRPTLFQDLSRSGHSQRLGRLAVTGLQRLQHA
jgi:hypothetical protein